MLKFRLWFASGDDADDDDEALLVEEDLMPGFVEYADPDQAPGIPLPADMDAAYKALIAQVKAQQAEAAKPAPPQIIVQVRPVENGWLITWQPDMPFTPPGSSHTRFVATVQEAQQMLGSLLSGE